MLTRCLGCMQTFDDQYQICPHCGYVAGTPAEEAIHMPPGTLLHGRYTLGRVLGFGGFGVTYLAWDSRLEQKVAIKEYMPSEFSTRMPGQSQVSIFSGDKAEQFRDGLRQFVEEAKRLATFQNEEGIATVYDSFEENDTAYIVMEYLEGETLTDYLKREGKIPEDKAVAMLLPLMESLQRVHEAGILHRDIAPDNIFLTADGRVKLIDFGAARYATTSHSRSLTVIIKPGYSPEEQYRSRGDQGPHTDVYALGATLYKMITGITPPDAMERRARYENQNKDILEAPQKNAKGLSLARRNAILNAMNVRIEDRTPDVASFMQELNAKPSAKRVYGKIKKIDLYAWPLWLKVLLPSLGTLVVALGVLLLTGVISIRSPYSGDIILPEGVVEVPEVEGLSSAEAIRLLTESRLITQSGGNVKSEYVAAGLIILQNPSPGSYVPVNSAVELMVSAGTGVTPPFNGVATVPYVIWDSLEEARSKLAEAGLGKPLVEEVYDDNVAEGQVISANHEAGEELVEQSVLTVTVSKGPAPFALQNVVGMEEGAARKILEEKGLQLSFVYQNDSTVPEGQVLEQSLEEGTQVRKGDALSLVISSGKPTFDVADVSGMEQKEAEKSLKDQGFEVVILENFDDEIPAGQVIRQEPAAGTSQTEGSQITVYISKGRQMVTITFDPNGGEVSEEKRELAVGGSFGELPEPSRKGYTFEGWFEAKKDGKKAEPGMQAGTANVTLQARWKEIVAVETTVAPTTPAPTTPAPTMPEPTQPAATTAVAQATTAYVPPTTAYVPPTFAPTTTAYVQTTTPVPTTTVAPTTVPPTLPVATTVAPTTSATTTTVAMTTTTNTTTEAPTTDSSIIASGADNDDSSNVKWVLEKNGLLTISGKGTIWFGHDWNYRDYVKTVVIESGITGIGGWTFYECKKMTSITIPDSVVDMGNGALAYCENLTEITIPQGVTTINTQVFLGCQRLIRVTIPHGVTSIGMSAFADCRALTSITIPGGVTSIGDGAFNRCSNLSSIVLPNGITSIESHTFSDCDSLKSIIIPDGVKTIGNSAFNDCNSLSNITIPESVSSIGEHAFINCWSLNSITIPEGVKTITDYVFHRCFALTSITVPKSVESIGEWAFGQCDSLKTVKYMGSKESWGKIQIGDHNDALFNADIEYGN